MTRLGFEGPTSRCYRENIAILLLSVLPFLPTLQGDFLWDDLDLTDPKRLEHPSLSFTTPYLPTSSSFVSPYYRPLTTLFMAAEHAIWGHFSPAFHAVSLLLHAANALILLQLVRTFRPTFSHLPLAAAALFAVHPVHLEGIGWISGQPDLLAGLFALAALRFFFQAFDSMRISPNPNNTNFILGSVCYFLSLLAKESAAALPVAVAVGAVARLRPRPFFPFLAWVTALFLPLLVYALLRTHVLSAAHQTLLQLTGQPWPLRIATAFRILGAYVLRFLRPLPVCAEWEIQPADTVFPWDGLLACAGLLLAARIWLKEGTLEAFGILLFAILLLPVLNLIPLQETVAERYLYLPSAGLCITLAGLGGRLERWIEERQEQNADRPLYPRFRNTMIPLAFFLLSGTFVWMSWQSSVIWRSERTLFEHQVLCAPTSARAWMNRGKVNLKDERYDAAQSDLEHSLELDPREVHSLNLLAELQLRMQMPSQALPYLERSLAIHAVQPAAELMQARTYLALGNYLSALAAAERAYQQRPTDPDTLHDLAVIALQAGKPERAQMVFEALHRLEAPTVSSLNSLGIARISQGNVAGALRCFEAALELDPAHLASHCNLGRTLAQTAEHGRAISELQICISKSDPSPPWAAKLLQQLQAQ